MSSGIVDDPDEPIVTGASCFERTSFSPGRPELLHALTPSMHVAQLGSIFLGLLYSTPPAQAHTLVFTTPRISFNECESEFAQRELKDLAKSLESITRLFGKDPFKAAKLSAPEALFYANNPSTLPAARAGR